VAASTIILSSISGQALNPLWLSLAGLGLAAWIVMMGLLVKDETEVIPVINLVVLLPTGLAFCALSAMNRPDAALWTWRVIGIVASLTGVLSLGKVLSEDSGIMTVVGLIFCVAVWVGFVIFSFIVQPATAGNSSEVATVTVPSVNPMAIWRTATPIVFGLCGLLFLLLFVVRVQRGDLPSIETNSGGIGSGLGGWRVSASLTYLIGLAVFGALLYVALPRDETKAASTAGPPVVQKQTAPVQKTGSASANSATPEPSKPPDVPQ